MLTTIKKWYIRRFSDPQAIGLLFFLGALILGLYFFSNLVAPLLIAISLAYLLDYPVKFLNEKLKLPRLLAVILVLCSILSVLTLIILGLMPTLWGQVVKLISDLPDMLNKINDWLLSLPQNYPEYIDYKMIDSLFLNLKNTVLGVGEKALSVSISSIVSLVGIGIYTFLVPLMIFFLLKDKQEFLSDVNKLLPRNSQLIKKVASEMQIKMASYIRGKLLEIFIVSVASFCLFFSFGLNYSLLLAVLAGISVLVPYIGAVLVTIPVVLATMLQFGFNSELYYILIGHVVIQLLDGNLVVPFLFSEVSNLHPLTIIVAVLIFGGLWGFWGVFFAIPLATLIKVIAYSWPSNE